VTGPIFHTEHPYDDYPAERFYADLSGYKLTRDPGAKFEYSSVGMGLLGHVIALKGGTNYESLVVDRICRPLKMDSTRITLTPELRCRSATAHNDLGYATYKVPNCLCELWTSHPQDSARHKEIAMMGWGELHSTVNDLLKYASANLGLTPSSLTPLMEKTHAVRFQQSWDTGVGLAWFITPGPQGTKIISHAGDDTGFSSFVGLDPTRRRGVVILINSYDVADACALGISLLESEWNSDRRPKESTIDKKIYESYVGQYQLSPDFALGRLMLRQFLRNAPKSLLCVPVGVCLVTLVFLFARAAGYRKRCVVLGGATLVAGALAALQVLTMNHLVCANWRLSVGVRLEGNRMFAQYALDRRQPSAGISELLQKAPLNLAVNDVIWKSVQIGPVQPRLIGWNRLGLASAMAMIPRSCTLKSAASLWETAL
jgi:Beta-lactamase